MAIKKYQSSNIERNGPIGRWNNRVAYSPNGYAYRPDELLVSVGESGADVLQAITKVVGGTEFKTTELFDREVVITFELPIDIDSVVDTLRKQGFAVDPNYVLFNHSSCCSGGSSPVAANPFYANSVSANPFYANAMSANGVGANPFYANSVSANPFYANPFYANPFYANPFYANRHQTSGERPSSALPSDPPSLTVTNELASRLPADKAKVFILDTGIADELPSFLDNRENYDSDRADRDAPDESEDGFLDPASGHGTFIAGIVEQLAPNQQTFVCRVLSTFGDGDVADIAGRLDELRTNPEPGQTIDEYTIINLSFGGYADVDMPTLRKAIEAVQALGAVVVASAGNDGLCQLMYPAAFPGVIGVGSIEPQGRAHYSNHGPWVRACAPGSGLTSAFHRYNGDTPPEDGSDPDKFDEWAAWTGTSFAAPVVAAALARHIASTGEAAQKAVTAIIDAPGLFRYPGLGTVVNMTPGM